MGDLQHLPYNELPPGHIRLFHINSNYSTGDDGSLEIVLLEEAPPFYALSHSWGTQIQNATVQIDGCVTYVTPDLALAIRRLRELTAVESSLSPPALYIWIDYLCIDQRDTAERSSQVALMRRIYSRSIRTIIWLGPDHNSNCAAWQLVEQIYDICQTQHPTAKTPGDIPVRAYSSSLHSASGLPAWSHTLWDHIADLMKVPWFSRIWVLQEVVLSPQDPIVLHGRGIYSWHNLKWATAWMSRNGYTRLSRVPETLRNVYTMCSVRQSSVRWPLDALLSMTQIKFHATDQRDKIFALLGLAAECQDGKEPPEALRPDYSMDVARIYRRVARFLLEKNGSLALLTRAHGTPGSLTRRQRVRDMADLPSWTPDWSDFRTFNNGIRTSLSWVHYSDPERPPRLGFPGQYRASGDRGLELHKTVSHGFIRVSGIRLGEVTQVVSFSNQGMSRKEFESSLGSKLSAVWDVSNSTVWMEADIITRLTRFIKATTAEQHNLIGRVWQQGFKDGLAYLLRLPLHKKPQPQVTLPRVKDDNTRAMEMLQSLSRGGEPDKYAVLACNYCFYRCFIVTSTGNIGLGPSDTRVGDCVSVILGGGVPYIIRSLGSGWSFVGESYLEGYMNGEALQDCEKGFAKEEILDIA
ncbi:hypothetical protein ED733_006948 [Metarhizium rileyi]|uniref:Heterokaryon incompatibility domain-containing protein n=1 Tax=Metarhizium rileyi (strain RCEF 4871) TaxID=1649241 RepID=A0A5C6GH89_METRR|nr:hypothetical protein ED733_006948 [Metarhizium rileyi]